MTIEGRHFRTIKGPCKGASDETDKTALDRPPRIRTFGGIGWAPCLGAYVDLAIIRYDLRAQS